MVVNTDIDIEEETGEEIEVNEFTPRAIDVRGYGEVIFEPDDFTSDEAWFDFLDGKEVYQDDFTDNDQWLKYDYIRLRLFRGCVVCSGKERGGKTLWAAKTAYLMKRLFGKKVVANFHLKPGFGEYTYLDESVYVEAWEKLTDVAKNGGKVSSDEMQKELALYNAVVIIDEAHKVLHCRRGMSAYALLLGDSIKEWGHNQNLIILITPNPKELDKKLVLARRTHAVTCKYEYFYEETSSYWISLLDDNGMPITTVIRHTQPKDWGHLWHSENIQGMRPVLRTKDGKKLKI